MEVVVTSYGSAGDFNPLLAIAGALVGRGVGVSFVANPFYERRVRSTGCRFVGAGQPFDIFAALEANPRYFGGVSGAMALWKELVAPSIRDIFPAVRDTAQRTGATVVVSHLLSCGGAWAAAQAKLRSVVVTTTPSAWLSRHQPTVLGNWRAPRIVHSALTLMMRPLGGVVLRRLVRPLAAELGAPPVLDIVRAADLNLGVWPEWFRPQAPDDPPRSQLCGFVFDGGPAPQPLAPEVESFLAAGAAPVVAGFGSAASLHAAARYRAVASACAKIGRRCLLIGASARGIESPPDTLAVASAPYVSVFPAAAAIVHHGGFGTCGEALRAGKPSLVTPFGFDQFDTAARVDAARCGNWLNGAADRADLVALALDSLLGNEPVAAAARDAGHRIAAAADGADRAAELIQAL